MAMAVNPAERIRDLKYESRLGKEVKLENTMEGATRFGKAALQSNRYRLRGTKGYFLQTGWRKPCRPGMIESIGRPSMKRYKHRSNLLCKD
jgi:hypothetical protein